MVGDTIKTMPIIVNINSPPFPNFNANLNAISREFEYSLLILRTT